MKCKNTHLVYYTAYFTQAGASYTSILQPHLKSVESLRKFNHSVPISFMVWGRKLRKQDQEYLEELRVDVRYLGNYRDRLKCYLPEAWADVFARYPSGPSVLSLRNLMTTRFERILYVENDTLFTDNVEKLFSRYRVGDLYAREEPSTKRSYLGNDPDYIDESVLRALLRSERLNRIIPFNIGVVLMKRRVAEWLSVNVNLFLAYLLRFTIWVAQHPCSTPEQSFVKAARKLKLRKPDIRFTPLVYPSRNQWILGEFALWFALAASRFKIRLFPVSAVLQANEFLALDSRKTVPCLIHYYSGNAEHFRNKWLPNFERCLARIKGDEQPRPTGSGDGGSSSDHAGNRIQ